MSLAAFQQCFRDIVLNAPKNLQDTDILHQWLSNCEGSNQTINTLFLQPDLERLQQYQFMVNANLSDALLAVYTYTAELLVSDWDTLVLQFVKQHPPTGYQFYHCTKAFPDFLMHQKDYLQQYPFLVDLARYELLEATVLRASNGQSQPQLLTDSFLPLHSYSPIINAAAECFESRFPIPDIVMALREQQPLPVINLEQLTLNLLWVYRDNTFHCRFFKINSMVHAFLVQAMAQADATETLSYENIAQRITTSAGLTWSIHIETQCIHFIKALIQNGILTGSVRL